jgi:cytochrome c-type biogenesis protein CcmI
MMRAAAANPSLRPAALAQIDELQSLAIDPIARSYLTDRSPATFKLIVDPLVTWMWIGGLIALAGALIALWPARSRRRGAVVRTEADALKEAKYREIRDAELDHASGKLSDEDFAALDAELRREALEILDRVENGRAAKQATANGEGRGKTRPKVPQG